MKSLLVLARIIIVGCLWSVVFIEGIRVIMLCNWHFDIFWPDHWRQARALWDAGWVVKAPKEWAFVIILITFFPMLITGWWTLSLVAWERLIYDILLSPMVLYRRFIKTPINVITTNNKYGVVKRKSYKQIRPQGVSGYRAPISDYNDPAKVTQTPTAPAFAAASAIKPAASVSAVSSRVAGKVKKPDIPATIDHALFKFDDDDDDFDLDIDSFEKTNVSKPAEPKKPTPRKFDFDDEDDDELPKANTRKDDNKKKSKKSVLFDDDDEDEERVERKDNRQNNKKSGDKDNKQKNKPEKNNRANKESSENPTRNAENTRENTPNNQQGPVYDALQQKGYDIISGVTVKNTVVDFIGVSESHICLCLVDKEAGDWLADEELFNGEEPLWFSENSHRISPVRKLDLARNNIKEKLEQEGFEQQVDAFVVVQMANIINADDMFEIWEESHIDVTRINRGAPKEIPLFSKSLADAEESMPKQDFERLRKVLKSIK